MAKITVAKNGTRYALVDTSVGGIEGKRRKVRCECTDGRPHREGKNEYYFSMSNFPNPCETCGYYHFFRV